MNDFMNRKILIEIKYCFYGFFLMASYYQLLLDYRDRDPLH